MWFNVYSFIVHECFSYLDRINVSAYNAIRDGRILLKNESEQNAVVIIVYLNIWMKLDLICITTKYSISVFKIFKHSAHFSLLSMISHFVYRLNLSDELPLSTNVWCFYDNPLAVEQYEYSNIFKAYSYFFKFTLCLNKFSGQIMV